jgi:hypothetical protein
MPNRELFADTRTVGRLQKYWHINVLKIITVWAIYRLKFNIYQWISTSTGGAELSVINNVRFQYFQNRIDSKTLQNAVQYKSYNNFHQNNDIR